MGSQLLIRTFRPRLLRSAVLLRGFEAGDSVVKMNLLPRTFCLSSSTRGSEVSLFDLVFGVLGNCGL